MTSQKRLAKSGDSSNWDQLWNVLLLESLTQLVSDVSEPQLQMSIGRLFEFVAECSKVQVIAQWKIKKPKFQNKTKRKPSKKVTFQLLFRCQSIFHFLGFQQVENHLKNIWTLVATNAKVAKKQHFVRIAMAQKVKIFWVELHKLQSVVKKVHFHFPHELSFIFVFENAIKHYDEQQHWESASAKNWNTCKMRLLRFLKAKTLNHFLLQLYLVATDLTVNQSSMLELGCSFQAFLWLFPFCFHTKETFIRSCHWDTRWHAPKLSTGMESRNMAGHPHLYYVNLLLLARRRYSIDIIMARELGFWRKEIFQIVFVYSLIHIDWLFRS